MAASVQRTVIERIAVRAEIIHGVDHQTRAAPDQRIHTLSELTLPLTGTGKGIDQIGPALAVHCFVQLGYGLGYLTSRVGGNLIEALFKPCA